jgi:ectoine hydroxylase-related dioxygenase (phytanoyl-CoA dioxygenase family)
LAAHPTEKLKQNIMQATSLFTEQQLKQFDKQGFCVLERAIPNHYLQMLREEGDRLVAEEDAKADAEGRPRTTKHFFSIWNRSALCREWMFSDTMAEVTRTLLGDTVYLVFEQYVIKAAEKGGTFAWHQDSGYVPTPHKPYLTCWCALDDVTIENGTVYVLPYERAGTRDKVEHWKHETEWDLIGYDGDDPGDPVICPAGSIVCFTSTVFHRSGANTTSKPRRVFLPQYGAEPLLNEDGTPFYLSEPFIVEGQRVRER